MPLDLRNRRRSFKRLASLCLTGLVWRSSAQAAPAPATAPTWSMNVPKGYQKEYEDDGNTLVLTPANPEQFQIRFTYASLKAYVKERPKVGREFIVHLARKKGLPTFTVDGNGGVAYVEAPVTSPLGALRVQETSGGLGLDDAYVTFTVSIDEAALGDPVVKELLASGLPILLGRIRS